MAKRTPETRAKDLVKAAIEEICQSRNLRHKGVWNAGAQFGLPQLDYSGTIAGHSVVIEIKRMDGLGKTTARQKMDIDEYRAAGATVFLIDSDVMLEVFRNWLLCVQPREPFTCLPHAS